ncbi:hypothetical protein [Streptomyces sp. NPDC051994]|uniref:hypothetical protein n=1 Tax=Streptomyces sp. NPDC051994 TaxID=3155287 RepID=UPI00341D8AF6
MPSNDDRAARWRAYRAALIPEARARHNKGVAEARRAREARLQETVNQAVQKALAEAMPTAFAEASAIPAPEPEAAPAPPARPLHELPMDEWAAYRADYWSRRMPQRASGPMTIGELFGSDSET